MRFFLFILFSTLEYLSSLILMLTLFRFSVKDNLWKFMIASIILSFISNTLFEQGLEPVSSLVQLMLFLFLVTIILRLHIFNALIMVVTTYFIFGAVQTTLLMIFLHFGIVENPEPYQFSGFLIQGVSSFYMMVFAFIIAVRHGGFSFVDHSNGRSKRFLFNKSNKTFFIVVVITVFFFMASNILYFYSTHPPYLLIAAIFMINLVTLLYLSIRRDV
jgi:hypothetical protein